MLYMRAFPVFVVLTLLLSVSCTGPTVAPEATPEIANPASVHCVEEGGRVELRTSESGDVAGVCVFADGSECDEWQFFRGACQEGDSLAAPEERSQESSQEGAQQAGDSWLAYQDERSGLRFHYPAETTLVPNDDPVGGLSIVGPLVGDDHWPMLYVSHPADRDEYRPPEGVDLAQWLADHDLMGEQRLADAEIAGTTAIHTRHERSPQSYAFDSYFFAHAGQLYHIVIQHTGDREDWTLYQRFLDSFGFDGQ
jgi:uncharacterized protein